MSSAPLVFVTGWGLSPLERMHRKRGFPRDVTLETTHTRGEAEEAIRTFEKYSLSRLSLSREKEPSEVKEKISRKEREVAGVKCHTGDKRIKAEELAVQG